MTRYTFRDAILFLALAAFIVFCGTVWMVPA